MTAITTVLSVFLSMAMVAMANSVAALIRKKTATPIHEWFFVAFFILLRVKIYLDDLDTFKRTDRKSSKFRKEFFAGVFFLFLWITVAAILPECYTIASLLLSFTLFLGTLILSISSDAPKRCSYIEFNFYYMVLLLVSSVASSSWSVIFLCLAILLVLFDFNRNESYKVFEGE